MQVCIDNILIIFDISASFVAYRAKCLKTLKKGIVFKRQNNCTLEHGYLCVIPSNVCASKRWQT